MVKTASDIIAEWVARSYITAAQALSDVPKYTSYIMQAKAAILDYCNLPQNIVNFPDGLFYPWVEIAWSIFKGGVFSKADGTVKSFTEGDTTINFSTESNKLIVPAVDYTESLNRYRRLP